MAVIPIGLWGTELVWPRSSRLPLANLAEPPTVTVTVGPALHFTGEDPAADTASLMTAIVDLLPPAARRHRTPTPEQLHRSYPPGQLS